MGNLQAYVHVEGYRSRLGARLTDISWDSVLVFEAARSALRVSSILDRCSNGRSASNSCLPTAIANSVEAGTADFMRRPG